MMREDIYLGMQCKALISVVSLQFMAQKSESAKALCQLCTEICQKCGEKYCGEPMHDPCQACAKACLHCAEASRKRVA